MAKKLSIADELRRAIRAAERKGESRYRIAKRAGLALPVLIRIADGGTIPRLDTAAKIAHAMGKRLTLVTE
jgi:DNA-binding phage protein